MSQEKVCVCVEAAYCHPPQAIQILRLKESDEESFLYREGSVSRLGVSAFGDTLIKLLFCAIVNTSAVTHALISVKCLRFCNCN